jgi:aspartate 1-decarboxylase
MREYIQSKIQNIHVTDKSLDYDGSVTICRNLMSKVNLDSFQKVDVVNMNTGDRWSTYVIPGSNGVFELNGGGARLGEIGDPCVVLSYKLSSHFEGASVIFCDKYNKLTKFIKY